MKMVYLSDEELITIDGGFGPDFGRWFEIADEVIEKVPKVWDAAKSFGEGVIDGWNSVE